MKLSFDDILMCPNNSEQEKHLGHWFRTCDYARAVPFEYQFVFIV